MDSFKAKYPAMTALLALMVSVGAKAVKSGESVIQKIEDEATLVPQALAFYPMVGALGAEVAALKASPADAEGGLELMITDMNLTSDKALAIMPKAFVLAEKLADCVQPAEELIAAVKA